MGGEKKGVDFGRDRIVRSLRVCVCVLMFYFFVLCDGYGWTFFFALIGRVARANGTHGVCVWIISVGTGAGGVMGCVCVF